MLQKLIVYGLSLIVLALSASPTFAQTSTPSSNLQLPTSISPTSPIYTDMLVHNMFHTFSCLAVGQSVIGQPCLNYVQGVPVLSAVNLQGGTLGAVTGVIGLMYQNPPVRTYQSLAGLGETLGIVKQAHAQVLGSGAGVLQPIQTLWQVSRNISYVIMIIIFVIIGLMVMFRQRINPQTVITAQAAIPGLVIGLILITFSYFLAGLISDTAFIGTNLVGAYFSAAQNKPPQNLVEDIQSKSILSIFTPFTRIMGPPNIAGALRSIWEDLADRTISPLDPFSLDPQRVLRYLTSLLAAQFILPFGGMFGGPGQIVAGILAIGTTQLAPVDTAAFALGFVAIAILVYAMFRLLLRLVNSYLTIIFLTITAPFQFLFSALPGRQGIATEWIMNILGNVLVFPAVLAVFYFVAILLGPSFQCGTPPCPFKISDLNQRPHNTFISAVQAQETTIQPDTITGSNTFPLFGGMDLNFIKLLLAFGALVALPAVPDIIIRTVGKVSQAGQLIGQEIGAGIGGGQRYAGQFQQGVQGFAGQIGSLTTQPGWRPVYDAAGNLTGYERSALPVYGARPGFGTKVTGFFRGFRKPITRGE